MTPLRGGSAEQKAWRAGRSSKIHGGLILPLPGWAADDDEEYSDADEVLLIDRKLLHIYLNDHYAGATVGCELVKRAAANNREGDIGAFLKQLETEMAEDRETLKRIMSRLGLRTSIPKSSLAWFSEKAGRLKLNGRWMGYSDLSRLEELEGLALGVEGKISLWRNLKAIAPSVPGLDEDELARLLERAERQRNELDEQRIRAAERAFRR